MAEAEDRFWSKVDKSTACWLWTASCFPSGYGQFKYGGRNRRVHRLAYELAIGPIPAGLTLDHLCRVKTCVNPAHLEPVTAAENYARVPRKELCPRGHKRVPGTRRCKTCSIYFIPSRLPEARRAARLKSKEAR